MHSGCRKMRVWEISKRELNRRRPFGTELTDEFARPWTDGVRNRGNAKALSAGLVSLLILCMIGTFVQYSNNRINELRKVTARLLKVEENQRRSKRSLEEVKQLATVEKHSIAKRAALPAAFVENEDEMEGRGTTLRGGAVYTRWGRKDCPSHGPSSLIYHGIGAGSYYSHTGSGANYLCLHGNITYEMGRYIDGFQGTAHIYGIEFKDSSWVNNLFDLTETMQSTFQHHSMPCAVCMANGRIGQVMIAGKTSCPGGWTYEYDGYIMTGSYTDKHSNEYICVDRHIQVVPGTQGSQEGSRLYIVEADCHSFLCEPVVAGREISCVVCTF